jgi:acyl dehydratase
MITMNHHPLHTNAWFAEHETVQGKNVVVGNLVYSLALGMSVPDVSGSCIANLEVESLLHRSPTFHGDTIYAETKVLDATPSKSKDDRGIVTVETKAFNQRGEEVCYFRRKLMVWKTAAAPARQRPYGDDVWPGTPSVSLGRRRSGPSRPGPGLGGGVGGPVQVRGVRPSGTGSAGGCPAGRGGHPCGGTPSGGLGG